MTTLAVLNQTIRQLQQSITNRLAREQAFKQEIETNINRHLAALTVCINNAAASQVGSIPAAAAVQNFQAQIQSLRGEITRLHNLNDINDIESARISNPVSNPNLRWDTQANKDRIAPSSMMRWFNSSSTSPSVAAAASSQPSASSPINSGSSSPPPPSFLIVVVGNHLKELLNVIRRSHAVVNLFYFI